MKYVPGRIQDTQKGRKQGRQELVIVLVKNTIPLIIITIYGLLILLLLLLLL